MIRKATAGANSNIAFIKWTIRQHLSHYLDHKASTWIGKPESLQEHGWFHIGPTKSNPTHIDQGWDFG
jgi:hypothetical protein